MSGILLLVLPFIGQMELRTQSKQNYTQIEPIWSKFVVEKPWQLIPYPDHERKSQPENLSCTIKNGVGAILHIPAVRKLHFGTTFNNRKRSKIYGNIKTICTQFRNVQLFTITVQSYRPNCKLAKNTCIVGSYDKSTGRYQSQTVFNGFGNRILQKYFKKKFQKLLNNLKKRHGVKRYAYAIEFQRNGNVHFHLVTNSKINVQWLANYWNNLNASVCLPSKNCIDVSTNPLKKDSRLGEYLAKYASKTKGQVYYVDIFGSDRQTARDRKGQKKRYDARCHGYFWSKNIRKEYIYLHKNRIE